MSSYCCIANTHLSESGRLIACLYDRGSLSSSVVEPETTRTSSGISSIGSSGRIKCPHRVEPAVGCTIETGEASDISIS